MSDITRAEAALVTAKAECFKVCGQLNPAVAGDRALSLAAHEPHRARLEEAYAAFQRETAGALPSNPAREGTTLIEGHVAVETGLN